MADKDVQDLLGRTEKSPQIIQRTNDSSTVHSYVVSGGATYPGRQRSVQVAHDADDATRAAAIGTALAS